MANSPDMPMPMMEPEAGPGPVDQGSAEQLAESVQSGLMQLNELLGAADAVSPEEKAELAEITQRFQGLIQALMQPQAGPSPAQGVAPPEVGAAKAQPAM